MFLSGGCSTVRAVTVEYRRTYRLTPDGYRSRYGLPPAESLTAPGIAVAKAAEGRARYVADGGHAGLATAWGVTEHGLVDALTRQATALALRNGLEITSPARLPGYRCPRGPRSRPTASRWRRCTARSSTPTPPASTSS